MNHSHREITLIKTLHTIVWLIFVLLIVYVDYGAVVGSITVWTWLAIGLVLGEGLILLLFAGSCPLTLIARKYSDSTSDNFDIYLPEWLARHNKRIFTSLFAAGLLGIGIRWITGAM